ncbi:hypothetical protein DFR68_102110 [Nocardia mexicana]|uniref:Uncharacterized protein n=1 Tax=Nocardia mexicana TaxID=279262 RepID=A0A370HAL9_9NOCA|nr:hypothetical protein DFR68_102110 [Nocardia mexicana]
MTSSEESATARRYRVATKIVAAFNNAFVSREELGNLIPEPATVPPATYQSTKQSAGGC